MEDPLDNGQADQPSDKFREPDEEIKAYTQAHHITLNLHSIITQRVLKYREIWRQS